MSGGMPSRLKGLPTTLVLDREVPIASSFRSRLLGLAWLASDDAGSGLLIPRCSSVHTLGMRFALDLYFLDQAGAVVLFRGHTPAYRVVSCRAARAVLEVPSREGGEFSAARA